MTSFRVNLVAVGLFVMTGLVSLVVALAILSGHTGATDAYYTIYSNVTGLKYGSQVFYEGYPVGQVEKIEPFNDDQGRVQFRVDLSVTRGWKIPQDSVARSLATSFLAPQTIAISAGQSAIALAPGVMIKPGNAGGLMESLASVATTLDKFTADSLGPLVGNLNHQVDTVGEILDQVRPLVGSANTIVNSAAQHVPSILAHVDQASVDFAAASSRVSQTLSPNRVAALDRVIANADSTAQNLQASSVNLEVLTRQSGDDLRTGITDFRTTMDIFASRADIVAGNLSSASRNLDEFSRQIRNDPSLLLRGQAVADPAAPDPR